MSGLGYENPDGSPLAIDNDYLSKHRDRAHPSPRPFEGPWQEDTAIKVW